MIVLDCVPEEVTGRRVCDRFFRLIKKWRASDNKKCIQSGVAREVIEEGKLMADMVEALNEIGEARTAVREEEKLLKERQQRVDALVLDVASNRRDKRKILLLRAIVDRKH